MKSTLNAMRGNDHILTTHFAFDLFWESISAKIANGSIYVDLSANGVSIKVDKKSGSEGLNSAHDSINSNIRNPVGKANKETDNMRDLELVDVDYGRDDPHVEEPNTSDDEAHYDYEGMVFTSFNHFIDIRKGVGNFDDYDGYSYKKGSGSKGEYQTASDEDIDSWYGKALAWISGKKVDEGIQWWLNDEYVHAPCHQWYRSCSPSIEFYSYPGDKGIYIDKISELRDRFPLADNTGEDNKGIPYSVFMPVDNLARYWYYQYVESRGRNWDALGRVLHAVQDASVPQHAGGCSGNWHCRYESDSETMNAMWVRDLEFRACAKGLLDSWNRIDPALPGNLSISDLGRVPARNWRIDQLVTWVALNAYDAYANFYNNFKDGYKPQVERMRKLDQIAAAMSALVLIKALESAGGIIQTTLSFKEFAKRAGYMDLPVSAIALAKKESIGTGFSMRNLFNTILQNS